MIILYGAGPGFGLPEISPYVTKTEVQLQLAGPGLSQGARGADALAQGPAALHQR